MMIKRIKRWWNTDVIILDSQVLDELEKASLKFLREGWKVKKPVHVYGGLLGLGWPRYRVILKRHKSEKSNNLEVS